MRRQLPRDAKELAGMVPANGMPEKSARVAPPFDLREALASCLPDVDQDIAVLHLGLLHLGRLVEATLHPLLGPDGLEVSEHSVLTALLFAGPPHTMSPTQLSQVILQTTSGTSKTLRRLERAGLIERVTDPSDGRGRLVVLNERGRDLAERQLRELVNRWGTWPQEADADERRRMAATVWSLLGHMDPTFELPQDQSATP